MNISNTMLELLNKIRSIEPSRKTRGLDIADDEIGNQLIDFYYQTSALETRSLIREFMEHAGFIWVKKLITKDTNPVDEFEGLSTLAEYTAHAAANDPRGQWFRFA